MGRSIDHRNTCVCGGKYLDSHRARHLTKSDKHLNWLAMQSSVQKQYQQECSPVNGQQTQSLGQSPSIMTDAQLIQFKQQMEWYNNYQQELIDKVTTDQGTTDSELWWDSYDTDTDTQHHKLETQFQNEYEYLQCLQEQQEIFGGTELRITLQIPTADDILEEFDNQYKRIEKQIEYQELILDDLIEKRPLDIDKDNILENILDELNEQYDMIEKLLADIQDE